MDEGGSARARARLLAGLSGLGLSSPEVIDLLASSGVDVILALMAKNGTKIQDEFPRVSALVPEVLLFLRGKTADAGEAMIVLLLSVRFITEEGTRTGSPFPKERTVN